MQRTSIRVDVSDSQLQEAGFTDVGITAFKETVRDYGNSLFKRATQFADDEKRKGSLSEVTHLHIEKAGISLTNIFGPSRQHWAIACTMFNFVLGCGVSGSSNYLDTKVGIAIFVVCLILGTVLTFLVASKTK